MGVNTYECVICGRWFEKPGRTVGQPPRVCYYARNRQALIEKSIQYARDHPEWKRAKDAAHRAVRLGSPDAEKFTLEEIIERDAGRCHLCGRAVKRSDATMDHIVPASLGGPHTRANVALAHRSCNASKGNRIAEEQLRLIG